MILILVGVIFRLVNLDGKIYWHDEVYTSIRAAGYTRGEIDQTLFQNQIWTAPDLQIFQQIKPGSTVVDTVRSLADEDPQHPPLYFVLARQWMQWLGATPTASRLLPALLSLLALPCIYALAMELFASPLAALFSTTVLALSPFDILFAQNARQYSLLTVTTIASSWLLLRAIRRNHWGDWLIYGISCALGFYTHPFFLLGLIAQGAYVLLFCVSKFPTPSFTRQTHPLRSPLWRFGIAVAIATLLYSPWIWVLTTNLQRATATTNWTQSIVSISYLLKLWLLSFTSLLFDLDFGFYNPVTFWLRVPFLVIILVAFYTVLRRTQWSTQLFLMIITLLPFLMLALPDLILGGKRSAVSRYLIACYPGVQLAVGYWLATLFQERFRLWRAIGMGMAIASLVSLGTSALSPVWWTSDLSYLNAEITRQVNSSPSPVLVSDIGDDYTNTGDLLSISYDLRPEVQLLLTSDSPNLGPLQEAIATGRTPFIWRPSAPLREAIEERQWKINFLNEDARFGQIIMPN